ncbi:MAG TPA: hypothetical protein VIC56_04235 [Gemmatimonadota bacterium]|jgi:hypothetical protein
MSFRRFLSRERAGRGVGTLTAGILAAGLVAAVACATSSGAGVAAGASAGRAAGVDSRVGLGAGWMDAEEAAWNLRLVSTTPPPEGFINPDDPDDNRFTNSDLAFQGKHVIQGNYYGFVVWDVSDPANPALVTTVPCPGSQNDVSVHGNLLFTSVENPSGRIDCGAQGVADSVSRERMRGVRIWDISDIRSPRQIAQVQTCRGSHTHTLVPDPKDDSRVYLYVSGSAPVRPAAELAGCSAGDPEQDPNTSNFRIEVIEVPLAAPQEARIVSSPRILAGLAPAEAHGELAEDSLAALAQAQAAGAPVPTGPPPPPTGPVQCHDITVYPAVTRGGGACGGYGLLLDIADVRNPQRIDEVSDPNFSYWHSATFNNEATRILFTDEWGGGSHPRCRATDKPEWGADAIFTIANDEMTFDGYYKLPAPQTPEENCVAHNGSLIPVPGRDIFVQGWYQGGISVFDFTDPDNVVEIAYFDRGPVDASKLVSGGSWSAYWYNGHIYSSEIARGLDVLELVPSEHLTQNEIDAAKSVHLADLNVQTQPKLEWPASFALAGAYLDQLERTGAAAPARIAALRADLERARGMSGDGRRDALTQLAARVEAELRPAGDGGKVRLLAEAVRTLSAEGAAVFGD